MSLLNMRPASLLDARLSTLSLRSPNHGHSCAYLAALEAHRDPKECVKSQRSAEVAIAHAMTRSGASAAVSAYNPLRSTMSAKLGIGSCEDKEQILCTDQSSTGNEGPSDKRVSKFKKIRSIVPNGKTLTTVTDEFISSTHFSWDLETWLSG